LTYQDSVVVGDINNGNLYRFRLNPTRDGFVFINPNLGDLVADNSAELQELHLGDRICRDHRSQDWSGWTALRALFSLGKIFVISRLPSPLAAAVLPGNRSVQVGTTATAFATIINGVGNGNHVASRW
jgi:hypothetical protein